MKTLRTVLCLSTLAFSFVALDAAHSQVPGAGLSGRVIDGRGRAVAGALVELWSTRERLAARETDSTGSFSFQRDVAESAITVLVRRRGYEFLRQDLRPRVSELILRLQRRPIGLEPVVVQGQSMCPTTENETARSLWRGLQQRYRRPDGELWAETLVLQEQVDARRFRELDTLRLMPGTARAGGTYFEGQATRIRTQGYAVRAGGVGSPRFGSWEYPFLDSFLAGHFVDPLFGRLHTLGLDHSQGETILVFCPRRSDRPEIEGTMVLAPDTTLIRVTWRFVAQDPAEHAGGDVVFAPTEHGAATHFLLPIVGFYWRRTLSGFFQEWTEYRAWHECRSPTGESSRCN